MSKNKREYSGLPSSYVRLKKEEQAKKMSERMGISLEVAREKIEGFPAIKKGPQKKIMSNKRVMALADISSTKINKSPPVTTKKKSSKKLKYKKIDILDCWWSRFPGSFGHGKN